MRDVVPSGRTVAAVLLAVVGVGCLLAFPTTASGVNLTVEATEIQPADDAGALANVSVNVTNLDERLGRPVDPVTRAAQTGSFDGRVDESLSERLADVDTEYVVYEGRYYRWKATLRSDPTGARIRMSSVDPETVAAAVATPYAEAPPQAQRAIDTGSATGGEVTNGVFVRDGTYYAVRPANAGQVFGVLLTSAGSLALSLVGAGYAAVGLGLTVLRVRDPTPRPATVRRAGAIAVGAVPLGLAAATSESVAALVAIPGVGAVVATGLVAGVLAHQSRWGLLVALSVGVGVGGVAVSFLVAGGIGLFAGVLAVPSAVVAGVVPFVYGTVFGADTT
ncbi:hypothetical protein RYH80_15865 [Halobaculum sp. MBLA0147]|uniref:hypothetical protein n=1 Tax=Halobaculum sp. MBLA0147 TaxID=3079934 RepID=UPI0035249C75